MYNNPTERTVRNKSAMLRTGVDGGAEMCDIGKNGMRAEKGILSAEIGPAESSEGGMTMTA